MAELIKLAVAMNQRELALVKAALEGAGVCFCVSTEHYATAVQHHPDYFPVLVAREDCETAREAICEFGLQQTLTDD